MHQLILICELLGYPEDWKDRYTHAHPAIVKELEKM
jgi:hypothetical protein